MSHGHCELYEYNPETGRYFLPLEHATPLADETFPYFVGGFLEVIVPAVSVAPKVAEAFRKGKGVDQNDDSPEMFESIERGTAPWYRNQLIQKWLPAMPQVIQALEAGGTALDVGCGSGRAAITLSKAFPKARVLGYDYHALSVGRAIANADAECANAYFHVVDCVNLPAEEFDFITTFDVVHDAVDPLGLMKSIRKALKKDGTYLMLEMNCSPRLEENANPVGRFLYAVSTLYCMTYFAGARWRWNRRRDGRAQSPGTCVAGRIQPVPEVADRRPVFGAVRAAVLNALPPRSYR